MRYWSGSVRRDRPIQRAAGQRPGCIIAVDRDRSGCRRPWREWRDRQAGEHQEPNQHSARESLPRLYGDKIFFTNNSAMRPVDLSVVIPSEREKRSSSRRWCAFPIALIGVHIVASLALRHSYGLTIFGDITQSVLIGFATITTAINAARARDVTRTFWTLLAAGCILWLSAQLLWMWYEVLLRRDVPNPFVGDIIFFLHIVPFMAALAVRLQIQLDRRDATLGFVDLALLVLWWLYLYVLLVIPWQLVHVDLAIYGYSFDVVYLVENLFFVAAVAFVALRCDPPWRRFYWHLLAAAVIYTVGSQLAGMAINLGLYYTGNLYDIPLVISSAWFGCAALSARSLRPKIISGDVVQPRVLLWPGRLAMISGAIDSPCRLVGLDARRHTTCSFSFSTRSDIGRHCFPGSDCFL